MTSQRKRRRLWRMGRVNGHPQGVFPLKGRRRSRGKPVERRQGR